MHMDNLVVDATLAVSVTAGIYIYRLVRDSVIQNKEPELGNFPPIPRAMRNEELLKLAGNSKLNKSLLEQVEAELAKRRLVVFLE